MEWGDHSKILAEQFREKGIPIPEHLLQPKVIFGAELYIQAFWSVSSDRPSYPAIGMIPFSAIDRYGRRYGFDDIDQFSILEYLIRQMDTVYLEKKRQQNG